MTSASRAERPRKDGSGAGAGAFLQKMYRYFVKVGNHVKLQRTKIMPVIFVRVCNFLSKNYLGNVPKFRQKFVNFLSLRSYEG